MVLDIENKLQTVGSVIKHFQHIPYKEKILRSYEELLNTDPNKIIKRWRDIWDSRLWGIYWGKLYLIGANTGSWKTTFVNQVCNSISHQWWHVVRYSLEDRMEDSGKEDIFFTVNRLRYRDKKESYEWPKFVNNEYGWDEYLSYLNEACDLLAQNEFITELDKTKQVNIDELVKLMENEAMDWKKFFVIDHLHYFEMKYSWGRHDLYIQNVMHRINEVVRKYNIAVFLVAHYRKWIQEEQRPSPDYFKDWSSIKQVANIIIQITRDFDTDESTFYITKLRWPIKPFAIIAQFDITKFEYNFTTWAKLDEFF